MNLCLIVIQFAWLDPFLLLLLSTILEIPILVTASHISGIPITRITHLSAHEYVIWKIMIIKNNENTKQSQKGA